MAIYDEISCEVELPEGCPSTDFRFRTDSVPIAAWRRLRVTNDGRLHDSLGQDLEPDGYIEFRALPSEHPDSRRFGSYRMRFDKGQFQWVAAIDDSDQSGHYYGPAYVRLLTSPCFLFGD